MKEANRLFHPSDKIEISIRVFHLVCQIGHLSPVLIRVFAPYPYLAHRPQEIGRTWLWGKLEKIARFEKLENLSSIFQNGLAFLGRIGKASLSVFPDIFAWPMGWDASDMSICIGS